MIRGKQLNRQILLIILFGALLLNSCSNSFITVNHETNPTKYIFNANQIAIYNIIIKNSESFDYIFYKDTVKLEREEGYSFSHPYFRLICVSCDSIDSFRDTTFLFSNLKEIFSKTDDRYDFLLKCGRYKSSYGYFDESGSSLGYWVHFHIYSKAIDDSHTLIEVFAIDPKIQTGFTFFPTLPEFIRPYSHTSIESSTIEEYEILLKIGELLGVKEQMPKCKYPQKPNVE